MATPTTLPATFVAGNVLTAAQMNDLRGAFRILQVVSTAKTDTFTTTSTSFVDVTGLSASITPSATSSKVLVIASFNVGNSGTGGGYPAVRLMRDSTAIFVGDAAGTRTQALYGTIIPGGLAANNQILFGVSGVYLDSPNTTSATAYKVQMRVGGNTGTLNREGNDADSSNVARSASSITVMEISA